MDQGISEGQPLVSVVMCAYNGMPYIRDAVDSILQQTYTNWELIISDDGSNDGTREWLKELESHPKIRLFLQEKNLGYVANKNFVHQQARGEFITQLDNDDISSTDRLEKQLAAISTHPDIRIVGCSYARIDAAGKLLSTIATGEDILITSRPQGGYPFWFPSLLVHHSVFEELGYFDNYFAGGLADDLYWTVRANERYPIWHCKEVLYYYRYIETSITNVLNNERKLVLAAVLEELLRQRSERGNDWLAEGKIEAVQAYEQKLLRDRKFMSGQYQIWAAKAIDRKKFAQARQLLGKTFRLWPLNPGLLRTGIYYVRQWLRSRGGTAGE